MDIDANPESLVSFVTEESKERPFSVVYGPEGLGKTTLVQNVYNKPEVRHQFTGCAWITLTHHLQRKTLWKDILSQIHYRKDVDELHKLTDQDLYLKLHSAMRDVHDKYLIVLDGICSMEGWEALLEAMPADKMLSKVVITTRNIEDTKRIIGEENGHFLQMRPLTEDQSWQFLKTQLLSHPSVFVDFESTLKDIYKKCKGVPLALKLLGNLMAWKELIDWNKVQQRFQRSCVSAQELLELSYSLLPEHLKKCLDYLALFPKETVDNIEADKLCNLWIADDEEMLTTTSQQAAETYLKDLATLGLVQVQEQETKINSFSLPHYVRDFLCGVRAKEQSLFATEDLRTRSSNNQETHRSQVRALAFHFDKRVGDDKFPLKPKKTHENVRSILFFNTRQQDEHLLSPKIPKPLDLTNCKLLRALDFNWLDFRAINFPQHINNLRYLSFRDCYLEEFPPSIEKLKNLETLDLRVNPTVVYKMRKSNVLRQLRKLRSLYLPYKFEPKKLELDGLSELENLQNFVSTHCRANDLSSLKKLRFLAATIVEDVQDLKVTIKWLEEGTSKSSSIHLKNIDFTNHYPPGASTALSKLLACQSLNALHVHGQIGMLPRPISGTLTQIFLISSELTEDPMSSLGELPKLQKLGLLGNSAFLGDQIFCRKSGFPELRYLKLSNLPELKTWTLEKGAMLKLSTLIIENCKSLETLPDGLSTLQELSIVMPKTFTDKYERQGEDFSKIKHVLSIKIINPKS